MIITDTLSNLFSKINNGYLSKKTKIIQHKSKHSIYILNILIREGYIKSYKLNLENKLCIYLKYNKNRPIIYKIIKVSKPSRKIYLKNKDLYKQKKGFYVLSTSLGFLTNLEAKKFNVGGELICKII